MVLAGSPGNKKNILNNFLLRFDIHQPSWNPSDDQRTIVLMILRGRSQHYQIEGLKRTITALSYWQVKVFFYVVCNIFSLGWGTETWRRISADFIQFRFYFFPFRFLCTRRELNQIWILITPFRLIYYRT